MGNLPRELALCQECRHFLGGMAYGSGEPRMWMQCDGDPERSFSKPEFETKKRPANCYYPVESEWSREFWQSSKAIERETGISLW